METWAEFGQKMYFHFNDCSGGDGDGVIPQKESFQIKRKLKIVAEI